MKQVGFAQAHWGMLVWAVLIASSFFAAAQVSASIDPIFLTALRLSLSALLFFPLVLRKREAHISWRGAVGHGLLGSLLAVYFASLFEALRHTSAVNTAVMYTLVPLATLVFELILLKQNGGLGRLVPMTTAAAGAIMLITSNGTGRLGIDTYPLVVYAIGCLAMAVYSPLSQRLKGSLLLSGRSPKAVTFWNMSFGAIFLLAYSSIDGGWRSVAMIDMADIGWLLYLALFATLGTFWLLHRAIGVISPSTVISYVYLSTLLATVAQWWLLQEKPVAGELLGAFCVGAGLCALVYMSRRVTPAQRL